MHDGAQALASPRRFAPAVMRRPLQDSSPRWPARNARCVCPASSLFRCRRPIAAGHRDSPAAARDLPAPGIVRLCSVPGGYFLSAPGGRPCAPSALQRRTDGLPPDQDGRAARRGRGAGQEQRTPCGGRWSAGCAPVRGRGCASGTATGEIRMAGAAAALVAPCPPAMAWPGGARARRTYSPVTGRLSTRILCLCISR